VVEGPAGPGDPAAHRGHVEDAAAATTAHAGQNELGKPDQAEEVGLELAAYLVHRQLLDRTIQPVPGVVDQHAHRAGRFFDGLHRFRHRGLVRHVQRQRVNALPGQVGQGVHLPGRRVHAEPGGVQADRRGTADPDEQPVISTGTERVPLTMMKAPSGSPPGPDNHPPAVAA